MSPNHYPYRNRIFQPYIYATRANASYQLYMFRLKIEDINLYKAYATLTPSISFWKVVYWDILGHIGTKRGLKCYLKKA